MSHLDPHTRQRELEVQRIIHLQGLANQLPYALIDIKKVTKSHIPAVNTQSHIDVLERQLENVIASEFKRCLKCGKPIGSKDSVRRKKMKIKNKKEQHMKSLVLLKSLQI